MTGLEKMQSQILAEAEQLTAEKRAAANAEADEKLAAARAKADRQAAEILRKAERDAVNEREKVISSMDLYRRTRILETKQSMIAEVLEEAYARLTALEPEAYFTLLLKMAEVYALPQDGMAYFSKKDMARMPEGYEEKLSAAAKKCGGSLQIAAEGTEIENGFVLVYGGMEENCTLRALLEEKKEGLSDEIHRIMFG